MSTKSDSDGDGSGGGLDPASMLPELPIEKRDFLFRFVSSPLRSKLKLDQEALYSATDQLTADKISKDLLKFAPRASRVADATACVGGNTFSLANHFDAVDAFELDRTRSDYLEHNLEVLGVKNVQVIRGDVLKKLKSSNYSLVFIDCPWGGRLYKQAERIHLTLSGKTLESVCFQLSNHTKFIALKVPTNFAEEEFLRDTEPFLEIVHKNTHLRKMHLLVFRVRDM